MIRKATHRIALLSALTIGLGLASTAVQAQQNGGGNNGGGRPNFQNMTPEQRTAMMQQFQEQRTRGTLQRYNVTDTKIQDVIVAYMKAQDAFRQPLNDQSRKVTDALADPNVSDAQLFALFNTLRTQVEAEKTRTETARKTLDTLVGYSKSPRLGVVLTMMGILGDESNYFNAMGGGRGGFGGGGFGGGGFGGGGGRGGQGGAQPAPPAN